MDKNAEKRAGSFIQNRLSKVKNWDKFAGDRPGFIRAIGL